MDLRRLQYFLVLAQELHFGRAAARLHVAQPALSQQIRRLEHDLGARLFDRTRHRVTLTQAGMLVVTEASRMVEQADRLRAVADQANRGQLGRVSVGFVGSSLYGVVPDLLRAVSVSAPDLHLDVRELETGEQTEALHDGSLDLGFLRPPVDSVELSTHYVDTEPLVAVVPVLHPVHTGTEVALRALAGETFVAFPRDLGPGYYDLILSGCHAAGYSPRISYEASQIHTMVGLVAAGFGVALVPRNVVRLQLPGVRYLRLAGPPLELPLAIAWRPDAMTAAMARFMAIVRSAAPATRDAGSSHATGTSAGGSSGC